MSDPYATHTPVLQTLGHNVKRVLELGSGLYSTPTFLDRQFYPELEYILSLEHINTWADRVRNACIDSRLDLRVVPEPIEQGITEIDSYDLIFIDNSECWENRVKTIEFIAGADTGRAIICIHDFEHEFYQKAAAGIPNKVVHSGLTPHTAICWR